MWPFTDWNLYWMPWPGVAIGVLGVLAVFISFRVDDVKDGIKVHEKILWNILAFTLLSVEVLAIRFERQELNTQHKEDLAKQEEHFRQTLVDLGLVHKEINNYAQVQKSLQETQDKSTLKFETLNLSNEIHQLVERWDSSPLPIDEILGTQFDRRVAIEKTQWVRTHQNAAIVDLLQSEFGHRVRDVLVKLKAKGIDVHNTVVCEASGKQRADDVRACGVELGTIGTNMGK